MGPGLAAALQVVLALLDKAALIGGMIANAQAQNRDLTTAELDTLVQADNVAKAKLDALIATAKAAGK